MHHQKAIHLASCEIMMTPPLKELIPSINALIDWMSKLLVGSSNSNSCGAYVCNHVKEHEKINKMVMCHLHVQ